MRERGIDPDAEPEPEAGSEEAVESPEGAQPTEDEPKVG